MVKWSAGRCEQSVSVSLLFNNRPEILMIAASRLLYSLCDARSNRMLAGLESPSDHRSSLLHRPRGGPTAPSNNLLASQRRSCRFQFGWRVHQLFSMVLSGIAVLVDSSVRQILCVGIFVLLAMPAGCTRTRYRLAADRDSYGLLGQKAAGRPWSPPSDLSLHPLPTSRLYDPTPPDDPWLPIAAPQLYAYQLPELPARSAIPNSPTESIPAPPKVEMDLQARAKRLPPVIESRAPNDVQLANHLTADTTPAAGPHFDAVAAVHQSSETAEQVPAGSPPSPTAAARDSRNNMQGTNSNDILFVPIPTDAWNAVPNACRTRMFEFNKLREEYRTSYQGAEPPPSQFAPGQRLSFEEIVQLTLLNSREYQTQKETLYRTALRLSLERYAYQLKFSPLGNGTSVNWNQTNTGGTNVSGLSIPTRFQVEKALVTGGDFIARFANDVVLTFNGPNGFAADVGSDLFLELDQTVFQRDVQFESLTQAERNVIYAARDFTRFRKTLFVTLASQYYNLIRNYRQVEIDSQNYFTLVRAFQQSRAEYRTSFLPRFQLDQVEQNVLAGRSRLIATCNSLESALDSLKIRTGLPTETRVNIDLTELEQLTTRDEMSVTGELIRRVRQRLIEDRNAEPPTRVVILSSSIVVIERMLESRRLLERTGVATPELDDLPVFRRRLQVETSRENAALMRQELQEELMTQPPSIPIVFQRTLDLSDALLELAERQLQLAEHTLPDSPEFAKYRERIAKSRKRAEELRDEYDKLPRSGQLGRLPQLVLQAEALRVNADATVLELDQFLGLPAERRQPDEQMRQTLANADQLLARSEAMLRGLGGGLTPIEIDVDDAMLTALNLRFDLMNQRGSVADSWRQIKYAGDDLKSILNISATHTKSTRRDVNRVFDFTFDESDTRVRASFDAPFNRRSQRNNYRQSLINYQASLRQLMQLEDNIKLAVRNDLRGLSLDKEQYAIEVASAALAYERVVSVLLELRLSLGKVAARDFLEAQNAYTLSLSNVASRHIGYIIDRTQLFLDLELLTVGDDGFWNELYDEKYQPEPYFQLPPYSAPVYGELVPGLWYSRYMRRMEQIPPGDAAVHNSDVPPVATEVLPAPAPVQTEP